MKKIQLLSGLITAFVCAVVFHISAQNPKAKYGTFALTNATVETVTKGMIRNATVVISGGRITAVGENISIPQGAETIDCKGLFHENIYAILYGVFKMNRAKRWWCG